MMTNLYNILHFIGQETVSMFFGYGVASWLGNRNKS